MRLTAKIRPRRWITGIIAGAVAGAGFFPWPLPPTVGALFKNAVFKEWPRPVHVGDVNWRPWIGLIFRDVATDTGWPYLEIERLDIAYPPFNAHLGASVRMSRGRLEAGRDSAGILRYPWKREDEGSRVSFVEASEVDVEWSDRPVKGLAQLKNMSLTSEPAEHSGSFRGHLSEADLPYGKYLERFLSGDTRMLEVAWKNSFEDFTILLRGAGRDGPASEMAASFSRRGADSYAFTGLLKHESLLTPIAGEFGKAGLNLEIDRLKGQKSFLTGGIVFTKAVTKNNLSIDLQGESVPGAVLDPFLGGVKLRGACHFEAQYESASKQGSYALRTANGRLMGFQAFSTFAAKTGLKQFRNPHYDRLHFRAETRGSNVTYSPAEFEGMGLSLVFRGQMTPTTIHGRVEALFSPELVEAISDLKKASYLLDKKDGRTKVVFDISGRKENPRVESVLPPRHIMAMRGIWRIFSGGFGLLSHQVKNVADILVGGGVD